jgi:sec-independent protein translocase protein TatA
MPGISELILILAILFIIFGAIKLPELGSAVGRMVKNFRRARGGGDEIEVSSRDRKDELPGSEHRRDS